MATSTPIAVNNASSNASSTSSTPTPTSTFTSSTTPAATPSQQDTSSNGSSAALKGGIAGGTVGGVVLVSLLVLLFMTYHRGRRYRKEARINEILRSQSSHDMTQPDRSGLFDIARQDPPPTAVARARMHVPSPSQGSLSLPDSTERDSSAPAVNIKELAAEIAKNIRQEIGTQDHTPQDGLAAVPEQAILNAVYRSDSAQDINAVRRAESGRATDSSRGTESTRSGGRQLPMPPQKRSDVQSVDTLPAYVPGHR